MFDRIYLSDLYTVQLLGLGIVHKNNNNKK